LPQQGPRHPPSLAFDKPRRDRSRALGDADRRGGVWPRSCRPTARRASIHSSPARWN